MFTWQLAESQFDKFDKWKESLDPPLGTYDGANGGRFSYIITHTSLGSCFSVRDNMAKDKANAELDVTDYKDW